MDNLKNKSFQEQHNHLDINKWKPKKTNNARHGQYELN
jgi:hypothetical protein